jgi:protein-disulfide isomerase
MHEKLFSKAGAPVLEADIRKYASDLGLDAQKFGVCMESGKHTPTWKASQEEGNRVGVVSTPTFFINGRMIAGAAPFEFFARIIDEELARTGGKGRLNASH